METINSIKGTSVADEESVVVAGLAADLRRVDVDDSGRLAIAVGQPDDVSRPQLPVKPGMGRWPKKSFLVFLLQGFKSASSIWARDSNSPHSV